MWTSNTSAELHTHTHTSIKMQWLYFGKIESRKRQLELGCLIYRYVFNLRQILKSRIVLLFFLRGDSAPQKLNVYIRVTYAIRRITKPDMPAGGAERASRQSVGVRICLPSFMDDLHHLISLTIWPYTLDVLPTILRTALAQSLAIHTWLSDRSFASASPFLSASTSMLSGSKVPIITTADARRKTPAPSLATAATKAILEFLERAASTLSLDILLGGGIHLGILVSVLCLAACWGCERSRSAIYLSTKLCVDKGLWNVF